MLIIIKLQIGKYTYFPVYEPIPSIITARGDFSADPAPDENEQVNLKCWFQTS